ncbi:uncharacterized protein LOC127701273 isoform X4 [Mytilus californianus]|nr:uncharacterized protein LOC127701273 isoform X4 [Mytilus californianus]XP_052061078.1 uncharacterized protein LOC127701273 isoform X4 [Mytilus californianus]XP_052061079.1 uncharacterized protein LOC127701273 isoform X4 [Mytilus californianus]
MDSLEVNSIKQDLNEQDTELTSGDGCNKLADNSNLVADSQNHDDDSDLKHLVDDRESPVIIRDETIVQLQNHGPNVPTSIQSSPDQLNDLQSYLVTFNKEIGHGGQPTGYSIGEIHVDTSNLQSSARPVLYSDGQIINVSTSLHSSQGLSSISDDSKVEISMTTDNLDPQSQTLKLAEALSNSGALLQQSDSVISQSVLSPLSHSPDQQRTVVLQGLPGAPGTLVQVNVPGKKVLPVVSLDGKEQMQVSMDSMTTVIPQIIHVSQPSEILQTGIEAMKTDVITTVASNSAGMGSLQGIQIGQADITNAQLIALQNAESANTQLVTVNTPQEIQLMGTSDTETGSSTNFQTVSIVPTSVDQGGEMNYVLIVSQPDGEKEGGSPKQFALDMGMFQPVFDFKEGQNMVEEVVDDDGTTRKIIRVNSMNPKKFDMIPSPVTQLQCHYCSYTAPKRYLMMRHMKTHSEDRPYQCNLCEKSFKTHASLQNHVNTHTGVRPHKCKDCEMAFTTSGELVRHIRYKHTFEKPHKCTECDYASVELSKLKRHMRSHTGERPYQCPHCPYASPDTYKLKRHLRIHTGEKPYECDVCHARFTQSNSLKAHKLIHSGLKPVFQCELCPTTCGRKTDLKIHMMKLHSNDKPVDCKKCGMVFQDRYSFKLHLKTHDGEKCFKCDQCEYAALSQRHLESHLLTHTGEKPFECDDCEQTFRQKQLLKRHKNLYHTPDYSRPEPKEKTYECNLCDKSFANKGNLLRHMQNHDPEYWNKKLGDGGNVALSTDDLIQGSLLNDMREGKLGSAPKVVIVHPNGSVEEVTNRLQNLVAEKQMEEMMVEVVQDDGSPTAVSTHSLEEAIRSQVEAAIQSHALKALEIAKTNSGDDSATDNLTIDLDRPTHTVTGQPKQTFSRQELEMETESSPGSNNGCITLDTSQTGWDTEHMNKIPDHIVIVKPKDKRGVLKIVSETNQDIDESKESKGGLIGGVGIDEDNISADLNDQSVLPVQLDHEMENGDNTQS